MRARQRQTRLRAGIASVQLERVPEERDGRRRTEALVVEDDEGDLPELARGLHPREFPDREAALHGEISRVEAGLATAYTFLATINPS